MKTFTLFTNRFAPNRFIQPFLTLDAAIARALADAQEYGHGVQHVAIEARPCVESRVCFGSTEIPLTLITTLEGYKKPTTSEHVYYIIVQEL